MMRENPAINKKKIADLLGKTEAWIYQKYKAVKVYEELVNAGVSEDEISDLPTSYLLALSYIEDKEELKSFARGKKRGKKVNEAKSFKKQEKGIYKDTTGGFSFFFPAGAKILLICEDAQIKSKLLARLYEIKSEFAKSISA